MTIVYRGLAVALLLIGLATGAYFVVFPLYEGQGNAADAYEIWDWLNYLMAAATLVMVVIAWIEKHTLVEGPGTWGRLVVHTRFYFAVALVLAFFNNWFALRWGASPPISVMWVFIDIATPVLATEMAITLWRESNLLARLGFFVPAEDVAETDEA